MTQNRSEVVANHATPVLYVFKIPAQPKCRNLELGFAGLKYTDECVQMYLWRGVSKLMVEDIIRENDKTLRRGSSLPESRGVAPESGQNTELSKSKPPVLFEFSLK